MTDVPRSFNPRVARAMRSAFEERKDGALICETPDAKRLVFFEAGHIVGAKSSVAEERLGEVIVRTGRIDRAQLQEAIRLIRSGLQLGNILVELGYLRGGEIEDFVRTQIVEIAGKILVCEPLRLLFSDQVAIEAVTLSPVSIGDVFLEAVKRLPDVEAYRDEVIVDDYVFAQTDDALALAAGMRLTDSEALVLDLVDGRHAVREILSDSPLLGDETARLLVALFQSGVVALTELRNAAEEDAVHSQPPVATGTNDESVEAADTSRTRSKAEPPGIDPLEKELVELSNAFQCQNHWQILGLDRGASFAQIEAAYRDKAERYDPVKFQHLPSVDFQERLSFVRARLREAVDTLSSRSSSDVYAGLVAKEAQYQEKQGAWEVIQSAGKVPEDWERPPDAEESSRLFKRARRAYKAGDFWSAIELCRASIELSADSDAERFHLLGQALMENPRWRQDAEKNLKIAQNLKPWEPRFLVSLGRLYDKEGLHRRAQRLFDQVAALDPDFEIGEPAPPAETGAGSDRSAGAPSEAGASKPSLRRKSRPEASRRAKRAG